MTNILSVEPIGVHETCDLEVDHPDHQFYLANGILTSNSHATAYAIDSYMCAWLLHNYPEQWLVAYLESMSGNDEARSKAFAEVRGMGYEIVPIDVNYATKSWTALPGKKLMPSLLSVKGVGETAADELIELRPIKDIDNFFYNDDGSWKLSKLNKRALEALIKIEAFESVGCVGEGKLFASYKQMHEIIVNRGNEIKKQTKKEPGKGKALFFELCRDLRDLEHWTRNERVQNNVDHFGTVDMNVVVPQRVMKILQEKGVESIDSHDGTEKIHWFCIVGMTPKKTKNGKNYLVMSVQGLSGKIYRMNAWGWNGQSTYSKYTAVVAPVSSNSFGFATMAFKIRELSG